MRSFFTQSASKNVTLVIAFIVTALISACNPKGDAVVPQSVSVDVNASSKIDATTIDDSTSTLKSVASFPIGIALNSKLIVNNPKVAGLVSTQFSSRTVPVFMNIQSAPGKFNFTELDNSVKLAQGLNLRLHGHCLVYHLAAPEWMTQFKGTTAEFEAAIKNHIQTVVGRQKGKIASWDVINEIFDDKGNMRATAFRALYPSDAAYMTFVKKCFQWAHEADPAATLIYNDYGYESTPAKLQAVLKMIADFKLSGTPINGIGTQTHINLNTSEAGVRNALQQLAATGLQVHMSELDIAVNPKNDASFTFTKAIAVAQRLKYQTIATIYKQSVPAAQQYGITLWDISDADSWLVTEKQPREMPTLFDTQYNKKAAFFGMLQGLK